MLQLPVGGIYMAVTLCSYSVNPLLKSPTLVVMPREKLPASISHYKDMAYLYFAAVRAHLIDAICHQALSPHQILRRQRKAPSSKAAKTPVCFRQLMLI